MCVLCTYMLLHSLFMNCLLFCIRICMATKYCAMCFLLEKAPHFLLQMIRGTYFMNDYCKANSKNVFHVFYRCYDEAIVLGNVNGNQRYFACLCYKDFNLYLFFR